MTITVEVPQEVWDGLLIDARNSQEIRTTNDKGETVLKHEFEDPESIIEGFLHVNFQQVLARHPTPAILSAQAAASKASEDMRAVARPHIPRGQGGGK